MTTPTPSRDFTTPPSERLEQETEAMRAVWDRVYAIQDTYRGLSRLGRPVSVEYAVRAISDDAQAWRTAGSQASNPASAEFMFSVADAIDPTRQFNVLPPRSPFRRDRVYLAAPFSRRAEAAGHAANLSSVTVEVVASWLAGGAGSASPEGWAAAASEWAAKCLAEVREARAVVVLWPTESTTGGLWVEVGFALALGRPVVFVGEQPNLFCYARTAVSVPTLEAAAALLAGLSVRGWKL